MKQPPKWRKPQKPMKQDRGTFFLYRLHWMIYNGTGVLAANQVLFKVLGPEWAFDLPYGIADILVLFGLAGVVWLAFGYRLAWLNRGRRK